jgi:HPt (histidine-containing phosphotransfer) domain-containing protein
MGIINFSYLDEVTGGDKDTLKMVLAAYTQHLPGDLEELKKLIDAKDWPQAGFMAHKVKSSARILGLESASWLAEVEKNAKENIQVEGITASLPKIQQNLNEALEEINQILQS